MNIWDHKIVDSECPLLKVPLCVCAVSEHVQVQTGFGRLGSHYWAFEDTDVEPDIGKMGLHFTLIICMTRNRLGCCRNHFLHCLQWNLSNMDTIGTE